MFVIDGNEYKDANDIKLSILFGVPGGVPGGVSFGEHSSGTLMTWLDDPSKGKHAGVIVINEGDKANLLFWTRLMEFFDRGYLQGGDNKTRKANKHLILITSNRGDKELFSENVETWAEQQIRDRVNNISEEEIKSLVERKLNAEDIYNLPDSIVNRIDLFTVSNLITPRVGKIIAEKIIQVLKSDYLKNSEIEIEVDSKVIDEFVKAYDPLKRGARPLVRALYKFIDNGVTRIIAKPHSEGDTVVVRMAADGSRQVEFLLNEHQVLMRAPILPQDQIEFMSRSESSKASVLPMVGKTCARYFAP